MTEKTSLTLYKIADEILEVMNSADDDGCIDSEKFDSLQMTLTEKAEGIINVYTMYDGQADLIDIEIKRLQAMKKNRKTSMEALKKYLDSQLDRLQMKELVCGMHKLSYRKSESVEVDDIDKIPAEFKTIEVTVSKTELKNAMKAGRVIEGARIVENTNLQIK